MTQEQGKLDGSTEIVGAGTPAADVPSLAALPEPVAKALAENEESLGRALQVLSRMEREGTLQELADLLALVKLLKGALTDDMVIGLARRVEGLAAVATDPVLTDLAGRLPGALRAAEEDTARAAAEPPGLMALLRQMRDPEVRRGLTFFLSLAKHLAPGSSAAK